jgi:hypothetical protein
MKLTQEEKMLAERDVQKRSPTEQQGGFMFFKGRCVGLVDEQTGGIEWLPEEEQITVEELMERLKKAVEFEEAEQEIRKVYDERMAELFRDGRKHNYKVRQLDSKLKQLLKKAGLEEYRFFHPDAVNVLRADGTMTEYPLQEQQHLN